MDAMNHQHLTVLLGPSAVGKGTVVARLLELHPQIFLSISATTRDPRPGEVDGEHYRFLSRERFLELVAEDAFLEWAEVHGMNYYGTLKAPIEEAIAAGRPALLEIDLAGARQVREQMPDAQFIFLAPPSWEELEARLRGRGSETEEQMARRLETARVEMDAASEFDHIVVNDEVDHTARKLASLMGIA